MSITLRDYQQKAVSDLRRAYQSGAQAPLLVMPTGAGKTVCFSYIAANAAAKKNRVLLLAHRRELVLQISSALTGWNVTHGRILPDDDITLHPVQVASIQTLSRRLYPGKYAFDLIVIDEAHHAVAGSGLGKILEAFPAAKRLGVTATPCRLDGRGLGVETGGYFDALVEGPAVLELIEKGHLAQPIVFAPPKGQRPDLSGIKMIGGDFNQSALAEAMDRTPLTGDAVAHYRKHCDGQSAIAFCVTIRHAIHVARQFNEAGYRAAVLDGETPDQIRDQMIRDLGDGRLQVLASCNVVSEGTDIPRVSAAILLRPTTSYGLAMQQMGRVLRTYPGKDRAVILDHAGNTQRHGLPTDPVAWSLESRPRKRREAAEMTKDCLGCGAVLALAARSCAACGTDFGFEDRAAPSVVDAELEKVDAVAVARVRRRKIAQAETLEELKRVAAELGYKSGWAYNLWKARQERPVREVAYG